MTSSSHNCFDEVCSLNSCDYLSFSKLDLRPVTFLNDHKVILVKASTGFQMQCLYYTEQTFFDQVNMHIQ
jgi:hypothetical protein